MRSLPPIRYLSPETVEEACRALLVNGPRAAVLAGGVDLVVRMKEGSVRPEVLVDLTSLPGLRGVCDEPGAVVIGALTPVARLAHPAFPLLAEVVSGIGGRAHRTAITLGGNLLSSLRCFAWNQSDDWREANGRCHGEGGDLCHARPGPSCVATHRTDLAPALMVLGAEVEITGPAGRRTLALGDLYRGDAARPFRLDRGEILTRVRLPLPVPELRASYRKLRLRKAIDRPILGVAASGRVTAHGTITDVLLAATGVGPAPGLLGVPGPVAPEEAAARVAERFEPSPAIREDLWWRRQVLPVLARRAVGALRTAPRPEVAPAVR